MKILDWFFRENKYGNKIPNLTKIIPTFIVFIILMVALMCSFAVVPAGNVGVGDMFGRVDSNEYQPGLYIKNPFKSINDMSIKTQEYTMSIATGEGEKYGDDSITAITKEGLTVALDMTVLYRLNPPSADEIYKTIGPDYVKVIVRPQIRTVIREVVAKYEAKELYSEVRQAIAVEIFDLLKPELSIRGVILEKVMLRNIKLPAKLTNSIEAKLTAEQEAEQMQFVLQKEEQEAERKLIEAQGIKNAMEAIKQELTPEYNQYLAIQAMQELVGSPNTVYYFVPTSSDGMGIPLVLTQ